MANSKSNSNADTLTKEKEILRNMEKLGITRAEAEDMWAFDHDEIECEEVDMLTEKARDNSKKRKSGSPLDKVRNMRAKKKADKEKQDIISEIFTYLHDMAARGVIIKPQEMGGTKVSFKGPNGDYYSLTITKHKSRPDGYND